MARQAPDYEPTPAEITAACLTIQTERSAAERDRRQGKRESRVSGKGASHIREISVETTPEHDA
jgi:hypothetical protein